jgi:hypothetical protein
MKVNEKNFEKVLREIRSVLVSAYETDNKYNKDILIVQTKGMIDGLLGVIEFEE